MLINYQFRNILSSLFLLILHESFLNENWADKEIVSLTPYTYMSILTGVIVFMFDLRRELWYLLKHSFDCTRYLLGANKEETVKVLFKT